MGQMSESSMVLCKFWHVFSLPLCSSHTKKHCWAPLMTKTERVGSSIPWYLYPQPNYGPSNLRSGSLFFNLSAAYSYLNDTWCIKLVIRKILFFSLLRTNLQLCILFLATVSLGRWSQIVYWHCCNLCILFVLFCLHRMAMFILNFLLNCL